MKTQKTTTAIPLIVALFFVILPFGYVNAGEALSTRDHVQIAKRHEALLKEAEAKLTEHQAALEDYESSSITMAVEVKSSNHMRLPIYETANNICEYESMIAENKSQAELHYKLAAGNQTPKFVSGSINKTQTN